MQVLRKKILPLFEKISKTKYLLPLLNCKIIWKSEKPAGAPTISHVMNTMLKSLSNLVQLSRREHSPQESSIVKFISVSFQPSALWYLKSEFDTSQSRIGAFSTNVEFVVFECGSEGRKTMMFHQVAEIHFQKYTFMNTLSKIHLQEHTFNTL